MEIKYIQLYDCLGWGANTTSGKIIEENEYKDGMWIPTVGNLIRLHLHEHDVIYEVIAVIYNKPTKVIRIKMEAYA